MGVYNTGTGTYVSSQDPATGLARVSPNSPDDATTVLQNRLRQQSSRPAYGAGVGTGVGTGVGVAPAGPNLNPAPGAPSQMAPQQAQSLAPFHQMMGVQTPPTIVPDLPPGQQPGMAPAAPSRADIQYSLERTQQDYNDHMRFRPSMNSDPQVWQAWLKRHHELSNDLSMYRRGLTPPAQSVTPDDVVRTQNQMYSATLQNAPGAIVPPPSGNPNDPAVIAEAKARNASVDARNQSADAVRNRIDAVYAAKRFKANQDATLTNAPIQAQIAKYSQDIAESGAGIAKAGASAEQSNLAGSVARQTDAGAMAESTNAKARADIEASNLAKKKAAYEGSVVDISNTPDKLRKLSEVDDEQKKSLLQKAIAEGNAAQAATLKSAIEYKQLKQQIDGMDNPQGAQARADSASRKEAFRANDIADPSKFMSDLGANLASVATLVETPSMAGISYGDTGVNARRIEDSHMKAFADLSSQIDQFKRVIQTDPAAAKDYAQGLRALLPPPTAKDGRYIGIRNPAITNNIRMVKASQIANKLSEFSALIDSVANAK